MFCNVVIRFSKLKFAKDSSFLHFVNLPPLPQINYPDICVFIFDFPILLVCMLILTPVQSCFNSIVL